MTDLQIRAQANRINEEANAIAQGRAETEARRAEIESRKADTDYQKYLETVRSNMMQEELQDAENLSKYGRFSYGAMTDRGNDINGLNSWKGKGNYISEGWQDIVGRLLGPLKGWLSSSSK